MSFSAIPIGEDIVLEPAALVVRMPPGDLPALGAQLLAMRAAAPDEERRGIPLERPPCFGLREIRLEELLANDSNGLLPVLGFGRPVVRHPWETVVPVAAGPAPEEYGRE